MTARLSSDKLERGEQKKKKRTINSSEGPLLCLFLRYHISKQKSNRDEEIQRKFQMARDSRVKRSMSGDMSGVEMSDKSRGPRSREVQGVEGVKGSSIGFLDCAPPLTPSILGAYFVARRSRRDDHGESLRIARVVAYSKHTPRPR